MVVLNENDRLLFELPYDIVFQAAQAGTEEVTYSNEEQDIPYRVKLRLNFKDQEGSLTIHLDFVGRNVVQIRNFLQIQPALAQGGRPILRFPDTGLDLPFEFPADSMFVLQEDFVNIINDLAFIQKKTGQIILWPGEISSDEMQTVHRILKILKTGHALIKMPELHLDLDKTRIQALAKALEDKKAIQFSFEVQDYQTDLLGTRLSLGPYRAIAPNAKPKQNAQRQLSNVEQISNDTVLPVDLEVGEPGIHLFFYDWRPQEPKGATEEFLHDPTSTD